MATDARPVVLVIEDEPDMNNLLADVLLAYDFQPIQAASAEQALAFLVGQTPDAILLDLMLPGLNGFELCRQLKMSRVTRTIPVLILTALDRPTDRRYGYETGADDYLTKPFTPDGLIARLRLCLERYQQARQGCAHVAMMIELAATLGDLKAFNTLATCLYNQTDFAPEQIEALRSGLVQLSDAASQWARDHGGLSPVRLTMDLDPQRLRLEFQPAVEGGEAFLAQHLDAESAVPAAFTDAGIIDRITREKAGVVLEKAMPPREGGAAPTPPPAAPA